MKLFFQIGKLRNTFYTFTLCYPHKYGLLNDLEINLLSLFSYYTQTVNERWAKLWGLKSVASAAQAKKA